MTRTYEVRNRMTRTYEVQVFNFLENAKLLYKVIMPFYIPISNV